MKSLHLCLLLCYFPSRGLLAEWNSVQRDVEVVGQPEMASQNVKPDPDAVYLGLLLKAKYALISGSQKQALDWLDSAEKIHPNSIDVATIRIQIILEQQRVSPARTLEEMRDIASRMADAVQRFPGEPFFSKSLGIFIITTRQGFLPGFPSGASYLEKALALQLADKNLPSAELADTYYYLGRAQAAGDDSFSAADSFQRAYDLDNELYWSLYYAAESYQNSHRLRSALRALELYKSFEISDPSSGRPPLDYSLAVLRTLLDPSAANLAHLIEQVQKLDEPLRAWNRMAIRLHELGHDLPALVLLQQVPADQRDAAFFQAYLYFNLEALQYEKVLLDYEKLWPEQTDLEIKRIFQNYGIEAAILLRNYAWVVSHTENYQPPATDAFRVAYFGGLAKVMESGETAQWNAFLNYFQDNDTLLFLFHEAEVNGWKLAVVKNLVQFYMMREDWSGALQLLAQNIDMKNPPQSCWRELADLYSMNGEIAHALHYYEKLLKVEGQGPDYYNNYSFLLVDANQNLERAQHLVQKALDMDPGNASYMDTLGWLQYRQGKYEQAEITIKQALSQRKEDREKLDHLGDIYRALGKEDLAKRAWSKALDAQGSDFYRILNKLDP